MSNPMEGNMGAQRKPDSKEQNRLLIERLEKEHPPEEKHDLFAEMYPLLTKKLRRKKGGGTAQIGS